MIHITQSVLGQITEIFNKRKKAIHLDNYEVGDILDHGGMSNIYSLTDASGKVGYVLRVSEEHKSPYSNDIFNVRELKILQELKKNSQPHVVQYMDAFAVDVPGYPRYYCAVMKFLCTLKQYRVNGDGVEIAVRLGGDFLPLLQSFTDKSILHRDIKPANIFYDADFRNETGFLLGDFGIAKRDTDTSVTPTGTESTMAPEVRGLDRTLGSDRSRSDMYSLGIVMYRYLNEGIYPSNRERIDRMPPDTAPFPAPRFGSKRLKDLVIKATSYYSKDRFESPQEMLRELQKCEEYKTFIFNEVSSGDETMNFEEMLQSEKMKFEEQLHQKKTELEDIVNRFSIKEQEYQAEITGIKETSVAREQEYEALKAQSAAREQELLNEMEALKSESAEREQEHLEVIEALQARSAVREQELLDEIQTLKSESAAREQELIQENEASAQREQALLAENKALKAKLSKLEQELDAGSKENQEPSSEQAQKLSVETEKTEAKNPVQERKTKQKRKSGAPLSLKVGDKLRYGKYPQGADGEVLPIMWRVLAVEKDRALIISELLIDTMPFNENGEPVTWEKCSLRQWLNSEFVFSAFGGSLPRRGIAYRNMNPDNPKHSTNGGAVTYDMVFVLSIDEAMKYFHDNADRMAGVSEYAKKHGAWVSGEFVLPSGENAGLWWLRSPGYTSQAAARVLINGDINSHGSSVSRDNVAVRPAMWISTK